MSLNIGFIGDSITYGSSVPTDIPATCATVTAIALLNSDGFPATGTNRGHPGSKTSDWLSGMGPSSYLYNALVDFAAASVTVVQIMLGTNDAVASVSDTTYSSNMSNIITEVLNGHGITKVILNYSPYLDNPYDTYDPTLVLYQAKIDALCNGTTILQGDKAAYPYFQTHLSQLSDHVHPNQAGYDALGALWETSIKTALGLTLNATRPINSSHLLKRRRTRTLIH